jgi:hypothetical protein
VFWFFKSPNAFQSLLLPSMTYLTTPFFSAGLVLCLHSSYSSSYLCGLNFPVSLLNFPYMLMVLLSPSLIQFFSFMYLLEKSYLFLQHQMRSIYLVIIYKGIPSELTSLLCLILWFLTVKITVSQVHNVQTFNFKMGSSTLLTVLHHLLLAEVWDDLSSDRALVLLIISWTCSLSHEA